MPETWVDQLLGVEPELDPAFRSRLEATLVDEWRGAPLLDLGDGNDDHEPAGRGSSRRAWLVASGIAAAAVLAITAVAVVRPDDNTDPPPAATQPPSSSTTTAPAEPIVVPATAGVHLDVTPAPGLEPRDLRAWRWVTASNGLFDVLVGSEDRIAVSSVDAERGIIGDPTPLEQPGRGLLPAQIYRPPSAAALYVTWYPQNTEALDVVSYRPSESGYQIVERVRLPADGLPQSQIGSITALDTGLYVDGELVLESPVPTDSPTVDVEHDAVSGETSVTVRGLDGSTRSWDLIFEPRADVVFSPEPHATPAGQGVILMQTYRESGEIRTNLVLLQPDGVVSTGFVRDWFVAGVDEDGVMLWSPQFDGEQLATAEWPD